MVSNGRIMILLFAFLSGGTTPSTFSLPPCAPMGGIPLVAHSRMRVQSILPDQSNFTVITPFSANKHSNSNFVFAGDNELELEFTGDKLDNHRTRIVLSNVAYNGVALNATLQLECGRRNMGLVNWTLRDGHTGSADSSKKDEDNCVSELLRDGEFRLSVDRDNLATTIMIGNIPVRAAVASAKEYIRNLTIKADAGQCHFTVFPPPT